MACVDQLLRPFGITGVNWLGSQDTALWCLIVVAIWKEAGFFMIFYLAALQQISPILARSRRDRRYEPLDVLLARDVPAADADDVVRPCECDHQRLQARRPYLRHDGRRAGQRDVGPAVSDLCVGFKFCDTSLRRDLDHRAAGASGAWRSANSCWPTNGFTTNKPCRAAQHSRRRFWRPRRPGCSASSGCFRWPLRSGRHSILAHSLQNSACSRL